MFIVFQPGFEFSTLKNPENDTPLAFIVRCSGKWCLTSIWPPFVPEMTSIWPCLSENGYLVTLECSIIPNHPRMLDFKGPRKHLWFWRSWRSNGGQNEVGSIRRWHIRKIWAKIELCAKKTPNRLKTVTANPPPTLKVPCVERPLCSLKVRIMMQTKLYRTKRSIVKHSAKVVTKNEPLVISFSLPR